jgi:hypothetical protein
MLLPPVLLRLRGQQCMLHASHPRSGCSPSGCCVPSAGVFVRITDMQVAWGGEHVYYRHFGSSGNDSFEYE